MELHEVTQTVDVPLNTGAEGFILTIRELLRRPRLQSIHIDASGKLTYTRLVREGEDVALNIDLETVTPSGVMINADVNELVLPSNLPAAVYISKMFDRFAIDQVTPIAWVVGPMTVLWEWFRNTTKSTIHSHSHVFGLPVIQDRRIPETALLLFGSTRASTSLIDTTNVIKFEMEPLITKPPAPIVEVI